MRTLELSVGWTDAGKTVGELMKAAGVSLGLTRSLKRVEDGITLNGRHIRTVDRVNEGDIIRLNIPSDERPAYPVKLCAGIVFEDDDLIVFDKPAGMTIHPVRDHREDTLANFFAWHLAQEGKSAAFRPVNRLDRNTSGLTVAALHRFSAAALSGATDKTYLAVCGGVTEPSGVIEAPIRRREGFGISREVGEGGEYALTRYETLASCASASLVSLKLDTGRMHQIRVHMSYCGHPLLGDDMYGGDIELIKRQALHCCSLNLTHPVKGSRLSFNSPLPEDMRLLIDYFFPDYGK